MSPRFRRCAKRTMIAVQCLRCVRGKRVRAGRKRRRKTRRRNRRRTDWISEWWKVQSRKGAVTKKKTFKGLYSLSSTLHSFPCLSFHKRYLRIWRRRCRSKTSHLTGGCVSMYSILLKWEETNKQAYIWSFNHVCMHSCDHRPGLSFVSVYWRARGASPDYCCASGVCEFHLHRRKCFSLPPCVDLLFDMKRWCCSFSFIKSFPCIWLGSLCCYTPERWCRSCPHVELIWGEVKLFLFSYSFPSISFWQYKYHSPPPSKPLSHTMLALLSSYDKRIVPKSHVKHVVAWDTAIVHGAKAARRAWHIALRKVWKRKEDMHLDVGYARERKRKK